MGDPYLTPDQVGAGSVILICPSCGYPFAEPAPDPEDRECSRPGRHLPYTESLAQVARLADAANTRAPLSPGTLGVSGERPGGEDTDD